MNAIDILQDKSLKRMEKKACIIRVLEEGVLSLKEIKKACVKLKDTQISIIFEGIEEATRKNLIQIDSEYLLYVQKYILSENNSLKREASRIVGNIANKFPDQLERAIKDLFVNTSDEGTVVRWSSAYALSKILILPEFVNTELFDQLKEICDSEQESGVKNQYTAALKKAKKMRKCE